MSLVRYTWLFTHLAWLASATPSHADLIHGLSGWFTPVAGRDLADAGEVYRRHAETAVQFALSVTVALTLYVAAVWLSRGVHGRAAAAIVIVGAALFQVAGVLAPDMLSQDIFSYAAYGEMLLVHGANPYVHVPSEFPNDAYVDFVFWKHVPSFYGPLWTLISAGVVGLVGDDVAKAVLLFRAIQAVAAVGGTVLVLRILEQIDPRRALAGAVIFGWNPLLVVEGGLSGHNDVLMVTLIVLAVALTVRRRGALACTALVAAGLIKVTALVLLPLLGIYLLRREPTWRARGRLVVRSGLVSLPLAALVVAPVWAGPATFAVGALGSSSDRYVNSLGELALGELRAHYGESREDLEIPLQFRGWWVATHAPSPLMPLPDATAVPLADVDQWQELLLVAPERRNWMKVFDPVTRQVGYVPAADVGPIERPPWADDDAQVLNLEAGPAGTPSLRQANRDVRTVGWGAFVVVFCAGLVLGTGSLTALLRTWMILFFVLFYATLTWFWPWYALWALPAAALLPRSAWSRFAVLLSWGVLLIYVGLGFQDSSLWYVQTYRAIPAFGLPLAIWIAESGIRGAMDGVRRLLPPGRPRLPSSRLTVVQVRSDRVDGLSARRAEERSQSRA